MKRFYKISALIFLFLIVHKSQAQELSTQGKTFWLTFMENNATNTDSAVVPELKIVVSCSKATSGTVKNPRTGHTRPFSIGAGGGVDTVFIPGYMGYCINSEARSTRNRGLIVEANDTVAVSAQSSKQYSCDASLIYPIEALGVDYRIVSHIGDPQSGAFQSPNYKSSLGIVATEDNTSIEITPSCTTKGGITAGTKFTIVLNKGESYQLLASTNKMDLSGTLIQALNCKKIAVFGGSTRSPITPPNGCGTYSYDHLYEQMMPINLWGKKFIIIPTIWSKNRLRKLEMVKVVANQNSTAVRFNGRPIKVLAAGQADTFWMDSAKCKNVLLTSTKPIAVCQFGATEACDGGPGTDTDPMMMWVPPVEQSLKKLSFNCNPAGSINKFFLNVIVKTSYRSSFTIDGSPPTASWKTIGYDTSYSYLQQDALTTTQVHSIYSPYGFSAILYAYGFKGSFGYNAGSAVKPLSFYMTASGKSSADFELDSAYFFVCQGTSIPFDASASYTPTGWKWIISKNNTVIQTRTTKSFTQVFPDSGDYIVKVVTTRPSTGVCNGISTDTLSELVKVFAKPKIFLMKDTTICRGNSLYITSKTDGDTNYTFSPNTWLNCYQCFKPLSSPLMDTTYTVVATTKGCTPSRDTVKIKIRDSLFLSKSNDTTICRGTSAVMKAWAKGGLSTGQTATWSHGLGTGWSKTVNPKTTTTYTVILTDGCTKDGSGNMYADTGYIKVTVYDSLKITMPKDTVVCSSNAVTLTPIYQGGRPGTPVIAWDNGLGTGFSKTVTMTTTKTYKAVLSDGCTNPKDSGYVTITVRPGIKIDTVIYPTPVCRNAVFNVKAKISGGDSTGFVTKLFYVPPTGAPVAIDSFKNSAYPNFNTKIPDDAGFTISLNQKCNAQQVSKSFNIKIKDALSIVSTLQVDTICTGQSYDIKASGSSPENLPIQFLLKRKNGSNYIAVDSMIDVANASFNVVPVANQTDYMIIGDDKCNRTDTSYFRLMRRNPITLNKLPDNEVCRRQNTLTYSAITSGGRVQTLTYDWRDAATGATLGNNQSITINPTLSMDLLVVVSDGCSKSTTDTARIYVSPVITDSTLATKLSGCEPLSTVFSFPKTMGQAPLNPQFIWEWYFNGAIYSTTNSSGGQTHPDINRLYNNYGTYDGKVILKIKNGTVGCDTFSKTINVYEQAKADFSYMPTQIDIIDPLVTFSNLSTGASIYTWNFGDTLAFDNSQNPQHSYNDTGAFTVMLIANNVNNCADTTYQTLRVLDIFRIFIPSAFSPNTDDFNTEWFPHLTSMQSVEFQIFNRWGEKVFESDGATRWNGQYGKEVGKLCPEGVYYYHIKVRDNRKKWHYYNGTLTLLR